jgi:hypothetical protein
VNSRDVLIALGASLPAAGLLARAGRRIGLPTIPLFMIAGLLFGPNTPGIELDIVVVEDLFLAVYLAVLQPVLALLSFVKAFGFLIGVALIAR